MPEGKLTQQLTSLLETAETLNTTSNSINTILNAVEQEIVKANIGLEVWLSASADALHASTPVRPTDGDGDEYTTVELGFAKLHDGWHVAARDMLVAQGPRDHSGEPAWETVSLQAEAYPLAQASRQHRIAALRLLPKLIGTLQSAAHHAIAAIEDAKKLIVC